MKLFWINCGFKEHYIIICCHFFNIEQAENKGFKSGFLFKLTGVGTVTIKKLHFLKS